jgi:hypothetical protein
MKDPYAAMAIGMTIDVGSGAIIELEVGNVSVGIAAGITVGAASRYVMSRAS